MSNASGVTPKGVVSILVASLIGVPLFIYLVIKIFTSGIDADENTPAMSQAATDARLMPVGSVKIIPTAPVGSRTGLMVYESVCVSCHAEGVGGAPKFGDASVWAVHLAQGFNTLADHAIKGFKTMPAKGGDPSLTDDEVKRAVAYMGNAVGAKFVEPLVIDASGAIAKIDPEVQGRAIYEKTCAMCHATGLQGAPKFGDRAVWTTRLKVGLDNVIKISKAGKGMMPPKGGYMGSDAEFAAAVEYMVKHSS